MNNQNKVTSNSAEKPVDVAALKKYYVRAKNAYVISYIFVMAVLVCNIVTFSASETFNLIKRFSEIPLGLSTSLDFFILIFFACGVSIWGVLRFKAWVCAGAALMAAYSCSIDLEMVAAYFAMSALLGACTLRMNIFFSVLFGIAAFAASAYLGYLQFI